VGSDRGKAQRWWVEKHISGLSGLVAFSRNQLLNTSVDVYANRDTLTTHILHEYFVPPAQVATFVDQLRRSVRNHEAELLNVTIRNVYPDQDSFLRYARREMFGLVILFNQARRAEADQAMGAMTRELIDEALELGGTYYLPYRLHATSVQFQLAYPQAAEFFRLKRKYDPAEIFQNEFYRTYGR
jgi:FAD/FMN-containing dehydrogenase